MSWAVGRRNFCGCVVRWLRLHPVMGVDCGEGHVGVSSGCVARRGGGDVARGRGEGLSRPSGPRMRFEGIAGRERRKNEHRSRWKSLYCLVRRPVDSSPTNLHIPELIGAYSYFHFKTEKQNCRKTAKSNCTGLCHHVLTSSCCQLLPHRSRQGWRQWSHGNKTLRRRQRHGNFACPGSRAPRLGAPRSAQKCGLQFWPTVKRI